MLNLKLQYYGHLLQRVNSLEKPLMLAKFEGKRRGVGDGWQRMGWLDIITKPLDMHLSRLQEIMKDRESWCNAVHGVIKSWYDLATEQQKCWSTSVQQWIYACPWFCLVTQSCLTLCQPHGLLYTSLHCPSPSPRACSKSYPWLGK